MLPAPDKEPVDKYAVTRGEIVFNVVMAAYFLIILTFYFCTSPLI